MSFLESSVTKRIYGSASDIISNLPDALLENILMRMPLRDAVRTSVLAKRWRYSWAILQQLVFDDTLFEVTAKHQKNSEQVLLIIFQVIHRIQMVRKFCLSCFPLRSCSEIDNLIIRLPAQIQEFTLHIHWGKPHKLPLCLFSYQKLSHLDLHKCVFSPPESFRGFSTLVSLELVEVRITEESFVRLISSCPLLENLKFQTEHNTTYGHIEIDNPSLKILSLRGTFESLCFKNASRLASLSLSSEVSASQVEQKMDGSFFSKHPVLEHLEMNGHYLKTFTLGVLKISHLRNLKILKLSDACLDIQQQCAFAIWLMLAPKLEILRIQVRPSKNYSPFQENVHIWRKCYFERLRDVHVDCYFGTRTEIELLKIILTQSRVLENIVIKPHPKAVDKGVTITKELLLCERLSPKAKIVL